MSCSGTIWILFKGTLECARVVEVLLVLLRLTDGFIQGWWVGGGGGG